MNQLGRVAAAALVALLPLAAAAQTVYRCGPEGRSYSQEPCPEGRAVEVGDARTREQQAQTAAAVKRDARTAAAMEKDRRRSEPQPAAGAASLSAPKPPAAAASKPLQRNKTKSRSRPAHKPDPAATDDARAVEPLTPKPAGNR